jgi:hypothetical protein
LASSRAQALRRQRASTSRSFGVEEGAGSAAAFLPYQLAGARERSAAWLFHVPRPLAFRRLLRNRLPAYGGVEAVTAYEVLPPRRNMQRHLGEVQGGVATDPALEEPRGGSGPGDGILAFVPADAPQRKRCSHQVLAESLARGLVEDAGPTLDGESRVLPGEDLSGEVGIQQALLEEQGDDAAAPDLGEGRGGSQGAA